MAKKKPGFIGREEEEALRENARAISEQFRCMFRDMIPYRIDPKTVILVSPEKDLNEQVENYNRKIEKSRMNY
jgi:hypothetical protein